MVTYLFAKELGWEKHHLPVFNKIIKSKYSGKIFECLIFVVDRVHLCMKNITLFPMP